MVVPCSIAITTGLSPHTRGNQDAAWQAIKPHGSIPAHAGEPRCPCGRSALCKVYPRTRGGTLAGTYQTLTKEGLSPHTRGNLGHAYYIRTGERGLSPHTRGNHEAPNVAG